ncbi:MAG: magnesium-translocating P-type ATPase [Phycisphaerae bacterium SM23_33]|nr:MAG: magnesium-translocating P-type ATPase [Phycisphaerae bacterium SM23_33]
MPPERGPFWSVEASALLGRLETSSLGLPEDEAVRRRQRYGLNLLKPRKRSGKVALLLGQFKSPIILLLVFAAGLAFFLGDAADAAIILTIVLVSGLLGFWQERGAANAMERLLATVRTKAQVLREGTPAEIPVEEIVPGDVVVLSAGSSVPGDCRILESKDLFVDEATLTGETYPAEKSPGLLAAETPLAGRSNALFMGTHVISGSAKALVVLTGKYTEFGQVSEHLKLRPPETEFERGVRRFGFLLMEVTLVLLIGIFAINVWLKRPFLDAFLFALALAVGLTPQLLPAIISVNLAHGARRMALSKVIVRRLAAIENFGSMNVLCSDKTGTLTEGTVRLAAALGIDGDESEKVLRYAYLNSVNETGFVNPIDEAIRRYRQLDVAGYRKLDEVPYDFLRRRLSIVVEGGGVHLMITKGAFGNVLAACASAETPDGSIIDVATARDRLQERFKRLSGQGFRILGLACRDVGAARGITKDDEAGMTFLGFLVFSDPPKPGLAETIDNLRRLGVSLKMITGDNSLVAGHVAQGVGVARPRVLTGGELHQLSDEALLSQAGRVDVFAEVEPNQKERIIRALQKAGNVVGYMGDGVNDASALHVADVGISVDTAVDVAKEAADIVLLEKNLEVVAQGIGEGRRTFANTLKYVFMATSANFGNMFSMAGASLFLRFLPLLPKQILLTNLMTDFPEMTIATDSVDEQLIEKPRRWDIRFIRRFMVWFGLLSSLFDYLTFGVLLLILRATPEQFRTGWFVESVVSACLVVLVVRSRRPFFRSRPGRYLLLATSVVVAVTLLLPYTPAARVFAFEPLPARFLLAVAAITGVYVLAAEMAKRLFYRGLRT